MKLVSTKILSERCGVSLISVYRWGKENRIPGKVKLGRRIMYDWDKVELWLKEDGGMGDGAR